MMAFQRIGHWNLLLLMFLVISWQVLIPEICLASDSATSKDRPAPTATKPLIENQYAGLLLADRSMPGAGGDIVKGGDIYQSKPIYQQADFWWLTTIVGCLVILAGLMIAAPVVIVFGVGLMLLGVQIGSNIEAKQRGETVNAGIVRVGGWTLSMLFRGLGWLLNHILRGIVVVEGTFIRQFVNQDLGNRFLHAAYPNFFPASNQPAAAATGPSSTVPTTGPTTVSPDCGDAVQMDGECVVHTDPTPAPSPTPKAPESSAPSTPSSPVRGSGSDSKPTGDSQGKAPDKGRSETGKRFGELMFGDEPKD